MRNEQAMFKGGRSGLGALAVGLGVLALVGCETLPPPGTNAGRVGVGTSTPAEMVDPRPLPADLVDFSSAAAERFMSDVTSGDTYEQVQPPAGDRVTILFGDIQNDTRNVSTSEFEVVRERFKNRLISTSGEFRRRYEVLIDRELTQALQRRELGETVIAQDSRGRVINPRINPDTTLVLNGKMQRINRGTTNYYLLTLELVDFNRGQIVWLNDYESKRF